MPRQIFDNDEPLLDYNAIDELSSLGIGDRGYAEPYPPDGSNTVFGDQFERRARELQRTSGQGIQPVQVFPAKQGAWTGNNQLGIEQPFAPNSNNEQTILKLDEWGFPEVWTVLLGLTFDSNQLSGVGDGFLVNCKAIIGVGGATQEASIDWKNGTAFSAPMNALNIIARYDADPTLVPTDLRLRVTLCKGRANQIPPTNTRDFVAASGAFSNIVEIPKFAQRLYVVDKSGAALPVGAVYDPANFLKFAQNSNAAAGTEQRIRADQVLSFSAGYPIARGPRFLSYFNGTANAISGSFIFCLDF